MFGDKIKVQVIGADKDKAQVDFIIYDENRENKKNKKGNKPKK